MPDGQYFVESGEVLGYAIGHSTNTYLDFGVYDLRRKNDLSEMLERDFNEYAATAVHGICWVDLFGSETQKLLEGKAVSTSTDSKRTWESKSEIRCSANETSAAGLVFSNRGQTAATTSGLLSVAQPPDFCYRNRQSHHNQIQA